MKQWEYTVRTCAGFAEIQAVLRTMGKEGWEAFEMMPYKDYASHDIWFKKELDQ